MNYALQSRVTYEFMATQLKIFGFVTFLFLNSVVTQPVLSSPAEWRALLQLRSSLGISAKDWHKKANPCLNWTGIACRKGHVIGINLSHLRRSVAGKRNPRFSVDSLPNFPQLSAFNSSGFILRGPIPAWFGERLKNLEVVDLSSSSISGSIPSSIESLSRLTCLCLFNNSITGNVPTTLEKLVSLSVLNLSHNSLTGQIPIEISSLVNLTKLDLSYNFFSGLIPPQFGSLSSLNLLNLRSNSLSSSIPTEIGNLSELVLLDLGSNSIFGSLPREIGGLTSLKKMLVGNNKLEGSLSDGLFRNLTQLEELDLSKNSFVEEIPIVLWLMPHLKHLDVSMNNLTGVLFPNSTAFLNVNATVFNFSSNLFYGNLSSGFGNISILDLSSNYFEGYAPPNETGKTILLSNNCFSGVQYPRDLGECRMFYAERDEPFGNAATSEPPLGQPIRSRRKLAYVMIGVFGGFGFLIVLAGMLFLLKACRITSNRQNQNVGSVGNEPPSMALSGLGESFTYEQMLVATSNFSSENLIKQGHSGDLFKGSLEGGAPVVVKRVDLRFIRKESFMSELELWSKVMHPRLVPLVGHCLEDESEKFLVYKYMPNGDLSSSLYKVSDVEEGLQSLDWITRLKIAIGAAEALSYLHHECSPPLVHRDIQASSILLDDKYEVRLGSLSEVCVQGSNNRQNMVAKLLRTPQTSGKRTSGSSSTTSAYDVYNFGKVLLELVTGKFGISRLSEADAKQWLDSYLPLISIYEKETMMKVIDQSLMIDEDLVEEVWAVAVVAKSCLNHKASRRPSMRHVLKALENPFKVVRDENFGSGRMRTASWTAAFFGSWHRSSSDGSNMSSQTNGGTRQAERVGSRGSGTNDHSSSHKRSSSDVFPEPAEMQDGSR